MLPQDTQGKALLLLHYYVGLHNTIKMAIGLRAQNNVSQEPATFISVRLMMWLRKNFRQ